MKKREQLELNSKIAEKWLEAMVYYTGLKPNETKICKLRTCSATVIITEKYFFLRSYRTLVAFIDRETDTLYDVLRLEYGYTSTSAQHISKFRKDYGAGKWGCTHEHRYYLV